MKRAAEHPSRSIGFLSRYHDGELSAAEKEAFDRHAAACAECSAAAAEYEAVLAMYRESRPEPSDPSLARRISRRIDTELRRRPPVRFLALEIDLLWASVAAIGLVAAIALFAVLGRRPSPSLVAENGRTSRAPSTEKRGPSDSSTGRAPSSRAPRSDRAREENRPAFAPEPKPAEPESRPDRATGAEGGVEGGVPEGVAGAVVGGATEREAVREKGVSAPEPPVPTEASPEGKTERRDAAEPPLRVAGTVQAPVLLRRVEPTIPASARRLLAVSPVVVEAVISATGDVVSTRIVRSNPAADRAVLAALRQWKYRPALLDGRPIAVYLTITVRGE
ncbi:MAG TPA: energy transducer TonB [Thermoanaerobaculia bacterium]|nr:energy transducer TonB [Thermoanaerobaculia bacterium]